MREKLEKFFKARPIMAKKYDYPGTFKDFALETTRTLSPGSKDGSLMRTAILEQVKSLFAGKIGLDALERQLSDYPFISYADHHGLLNYELLYNSNILFSEMVKVLNLPFAVTFATGNVPLKNISYPRGFYFKERKFNFFKNKQRHIPVSLIDSGITLDKDKKPESFILNFNKEQLSNEEKKFLEFLFFECLEIEKVTETYSLFSDQITLLNYKLWKYYFHREIRGSVPDMIYLQSNQVVLSLLLNEIGKDDSLVSMILFQPEVREVFLRNFSGIAGTWGNNMGSCLFWGITEKKKFIPLQMEESSNSLVGQDFNLKLEKEAVAGALKSKRVIPTLFFDFLLITFLEGYVALGGFNQVEFLTQMQQAHIESLNTIGMNGLADKFASRVSDGLVCGMFPFGLGHGIDLIWRKNSRNGRFNGNLDGGLTQKDLDNMVQMKVRDMIASAVETMLEIV